MKSVRIRPLVQPTGALILATGPLASAEFMDGVDDLATQERDPNGS